MLRSIKYEMNVMLNKKEFACTMCFMMAFCVIAMMSAVVECREDYFIYSVSANIKFIGSTYSPLWSVFTYVFSFAVVIPHSMSYIGDLDTGICPYIFVRSGRVKYYLSKICAAFFGNVLIVAIPFLINLVLCMIALTTKPNYSFGFYGSQGFSEIVLGIGYIFQAEHMALPLAEVFVNAPTLYSLLYIVFISFNAGVFGVFVLCVSFLFHKNRALLFLPVYLFVLITSVITNNALTAAISDPQIEFINYSFMDYLGSFGYGGKNPIFLLTVYVVIAILSVLITLQTVKKDPIELNEV